MAVASLDTRVGTIAEYLGDEADTLLNHRCDTIPRADLALPGRDFAERVWLDSDRNPQVIRSLQQIYDSGRLGGTGYVSILPVDQGIEHSAGASFAPNSAYFDPANIIELALEGGCNAVASTFGVLGMTARRCPSHPLHRKSQSQRIGDLSQLARADHVRNHQAGLGYGRGRCRRYGVFRLG